MELGGRHVPGGGREDPGLEIHLRGFNSWAETKFWDQAEEHTHTLILISHLTSGGLISRLSASSTIEKYKFIKSSEGE